MRRASLSVSQSARTMMTYVWRFCNTSSMQKSDLVQACRGMISANNEDLQRSVSKITESPDKVFGIHALNKYADRESELLDRGETYVRQGSGYIGNSDGLYVLIASVRSEMPFITYCHPEGVLGITSPFTEGGSKKQVVMRSTEQPSIMGLSYPPIGVYVKDYTTPIPVDVALVNDPETHSVQIVNAQTAQEYLRDLADGFSAVQLGLHHVATELGFKADQTDTELLHQMVQEIAKTHENVAKRVAREYDLLLNEQRQAFEVGAKLCSVLGESETKQRFEELRENIGGETMRKRAELEVDTYKSRSKAPKVN